MSNGTNIKPSRRQFIRQLGQRVLGGVTAGKLLLPLSMTAAGCSTLDEYLIEDQFDFDQDVVIIGGGIAALYAAHELKKNRIPFKIFEASSRLGGKIQTISTRLPKAVETSASARSAEVNIIEWGAFEFQSADFLLKKLTSDLGLVTQSLDDKKWTLAGGAQKLTDELVDIVQGLIPEKQIRMQHRLSSVRKIGDRYQLIFQTPQKERMFFAKRVLLALPVDALKKINNLSDIDELAPSLKFMQQQMTYTNIRVVILQADIAPKYKIKNRIDSKSIKNLFYHMPQTNGVTLDLAAHHGYVYLTLRMGLEHVWRPVQKIEGFVQKITHGDFSLSSDNCKDWGSLASDSRLSSSLDVQNLAGVVMPNSRLRLVSESFVPFESELTNSKAKTSSIEGLMQLVAKEVEFFKLDI